MTPAIYLALAYGLTLLTKLPVGMAMAKLPGGYDNRHPRSQQAELDGRGKRSLAAHKNAMEAFPAFACGLLLCLLMKVEPAWIHGLAITWLVARCAYVACYLANLHALRTSVWMLATGACFGLMLLPLM